MPRYDFKCAEGHVQEVWVSDFRDASNTSEPRLCVTCGKPTLKQPCAPNFTVTGYSAKNGYSR